MYQRHGCRCDDCTEATRAAARRRYHRDKGQCPDDRHGTMSGYSYWRCRCGPCCKAWKDYHVGYMKRYHEVHKEGLSAQQRRYRVAKKEAAEAKEMERRLKMRAS